MNKILSSIALSLPVVIAALVLGAGPAVVNAQSLTAADMAALLEASGRPAEDRARDEARKPAEVVAFSAVEPGMTVLDVMAASGWYSEVFAVAVGEKGKVIAQNPSFMLEYMDGRNDKLLSARLADDRLPNVMRVDATLSASKIEDGSIDIAFTALNFHDTYFMAGDEAALVLLASIRDVLKPEGVLVLIDHNGKPDMDNEKLHRIPRQTVLDVAKRAGFELAAEGDMLAHPEDDGTQMVFAKDMRGKTDRFVLKFRKAE